MTVEVTLLSTPARCRVDFRSATIAADLVAVRPAYSTTTNHSPSGTNH